MKGLVRILAGVIVVVACEPKPSQVSRLSIDIKGLLAEQVDQCAQRHVSLTKTASVGLTLSDTTIVPTRRFWETEFETFQALDLINKRLYQDSYRSEGPLDDPRSNLSIQRYISAESPLTLLTLFYSGKLQRVRKIEGIVQEDTQLYHAHRTLTLEFDEVDGKPLITHYQVLGYQELALGDTLHFSIRGVINW